MKFSTVFAIASSIVAASAFKLTVVSSDDPNKNAVENAGVSSVHEGAGINWVRLGAPNSDGEEYELDEDNAFLTLNVADGLPELLADTNGEFPLLYLSVTDGNYPILEFVPSQDDALQVSFSEDGILEIDSCSEGLYAVKNIGDPYNYSKDSFFVSYSPDTALPNAIPITFKRVD